MYVNAQCFYRTLLEILFIILYKSTGNQGHSVHWLRWMMRANYMPFFSFFWMSEKWILKYNHRRNITNDNYYV